VIFIIAGGGVAHIFRAAMKTKLLLILFTFSSLATLHSRTWTSVSGQKAEAEFVKVDGESVVLRMANGSTTSFPIARLSEADQDFIKTQTGASPSTASKPAPASAASGSSTAKTDEKQGGGKDDAKAQFIGTWDGYMADSDGSKHGDIRLVITEDKITASNPQGNREMGAGTYKISGRRIDATGTEGQFAGKKYEGIFDLEGKTLKWCSANDNPNSSRPSRLQTNPQAGQFLMVLEKK
jgi:uncharacterized protein (TIGR03067 family)